MRFTEAGQQIQMARFLGITQSEATRDIPWVTENKLQPLPVPGTKEEAQCMTELFGFGGLHIPHLGVLLTSICTQKENIFEWGVWKTAGCV